MKKRSPSVEKTAETRKKIIVAALNEFNHLGYANSKIASIAVSAGLGKGTIYSYFETKEKLFEGVIDYLIQDTYHPIQSDELTADVKVADFILQQMMPAIDNIESAGRANIARLILSEGKNFEHIRELYLQKIYQPGQVELQKLIEIAVERKELPAQSDPKALTLLILAPIWMGIVHNGILSPAHAQCIQSLFEINIRNIFKPAS
ncbi:MULTISPECIES: TetR/AcrR family transcriptional regulator [Acinetobacter]|jgi:AcrR family transcriptional regulator|uniref:TetR family transcriptional regulator n=1 Tax=Acinetobacter chengduensis TaxID=2420890 RepID=A0ABX9TSX2_9GAMM|nr:MULTISPECIES: TetR/AcrR family transcriptional regulator [Acinetobacter]MBI1453431.1 TetR/AcrR family transcriptional regulator [Acinetobacter sp. FL51]RKG38491.1 TetR/AcrR family transcriptional regulator [Acinetobacter sp. WCHAc060007]RLL18154.1 TetR family transcriptional regulator [Acinetobacter chengduensis]